MKKGALIIIGITIYTYAFCQTHGKSTPINSVQATIAYPIGTNGIESYKITNHFSYNMFFGYNGGVNGMELGNFINMNKSDVNGIQIAGFGNINNGRVNGIQIAGFSNINKQCSNIIQLAGFININKETSELINQEANNDVPSISDTVKINIPNSLQMAGFANITENFEGIQASGFINVAKYIKGIQIAGFINICDSIDGLPIAFINYVKYNGYRKISIWSNETFYLNTAYKIGTERLYTIFNLGYRPIYDFTDWSAGIGLGTSINMQHNNYIDIEAMHNTLLEHQIWTESSNFFVSEMSQLKISFRKSINHRFDIFGGPSLNLLYHNYKNNDVSPSWARDFSFFRSYSSWIGFNAGIQF